MRKKSDSRLVDLTEGFFLGLIVNNVFTGGIHSHSNGLSFRGLQKEKPYFNEERKRTTQTNVCSRLL